MVQEIPIIGEIMSNNNGGIRCGCGCGGIILTILMLWALCFGLPIGDKTYNIDIFPPQIRVIDNAK